MTVGSWRSITRRAHGRALRSWPGIFAGCWTARTRRIRPPIAGVCRRCAKLTTSNWSWSKFAVIESPTLIDRDSVAHVDDRAGSTRPVVRAPYRMSMSDTSDIGVAAHRGEHNQEVLSEWLGAAPERIEGLHSAGILLADEWAAHTTTGT